MFVAALLLCVGLASPAEASRFQGKPVAEVAPGVFLSSAGGGGGLGSGPSSDPQVEPRGAEPRIVGGGPTTIGESPWQVSLGLHPSYDSAAGSANQFDRHFCGGSLVTSRFVVSAAHCLFDSIFADVWMEPEDFQVVSGRTQLSAGGGQVIEVADYLFFTDAEGFPLYDPAFFGNSQYDVALLVLASPSSSKPIKIAGSAERSAWKAGRDAFVTGWGATSEGGAGSDVLKRAKLKMQADSACGAYFGPLYDSEVMVCAGEPAGGVDACQGDSGGPLVVPIAGGQFRLVGDTSFGDGCARPGVPGVYGRLADGPIAGGLAAVVKDLSGENILGTSTECVKARADLKKGQRAQKKARADLKKAKAQLRKAKRSKRKATITRAQKKVGQATKRVKKAGAQTKRAKVAINRHCR